jgi:hypothetical protein
VNGALEKPTEQQLYDAWLRVRRDTNHGMDKARACVLVAQTFGVLPIAVWQAIERRKSKPNN